MQNTTRSFRMSRKFNLWVYQRIEKVSAKTWIIQILESECFLSPALLFSDFSKKFLTWVATKSIGMNRSCYLKAYEKYDARFQLHLLLRGDAAHPRAFSGVHSDVTWDLAHRASSSNRVSEKPTIGSAGSGFFAFLNVLRTGLTITTGWHHSAKYIWSEQGQAIRSWLPSVP